MKLSKRLLLQHLLVVSAIFLCSSASAPAQVPVIPGAHGFGITTPAGRGGQIFKVTNLNDGDVLIQHLHFRPGDDLNGTPYCNRSGISIGGWSESGQKAYNI